MSIQVHRDTPNGDVVEYDPSDDCADVEFAVGDEWVVDWETTAVSTATGRRRSPVTPSLRARLESDSEVAWEFVCDGHYEPGGGHKPSTVEVALQAWLRAGDWDRSQTMWITGYAHPLDPATGKWHVEEGISTRVTIDPDPPKCSAKEHDWKSPYTIVQGLRENPGVFGSGGGVKIHEVCCHCGHHRHTDTWAQHPETGEQGLISVCYEDPDDETTAWVESLRAPESEE